MTVSEYERLKEFIALYVVSNESYSHLLEKLKDLFKEDIDSPRRFEQITNFLELLGILELRGVLSEDNVKPLKDIAQCLPNGLDLLRKINDYKKVHVPREFVNYYAPENIQRGIIIGPQLIANSSIYGPHVSKKKEERIKNTIIYEIGKYWRDFGRNLKISEQKIDEIDTQNIGIVEKAKLVLEYFEEHKTDSYRCFFTICDALEKSRRKDISKTVQDVMTMYI